MKQYLEDFNEIRNKKYREAKEVQLPDLNVPTGESRFNVDNYKTFKDVEILRIISRFDCVKFEYLCRHNIDDQDFIDCLII